MTFSRVNGSAATLSRNHTEGSVSPFSGMCVTCIDGCVGMCEIGKSAYRGHEVIYPQPFGLITTASEKDYPVDTGIAGVCNARMAAAKPCRRQTSSSSSSVRRGRYKVDTIKGPAHQSAHTMTAVPV